MTNQLSPSILAADVQCLGKDVRAVTEAGARYLHIDVMDGVFVPNISFGFPIVKGLREITDAFFDVHLMITEPIRYIERFATNGADGITVHAEACENLAATIKEINRCGKKPGIAISPDTKIDVVVPLLDQISMVLVMTVYPGYGGQSIIESCFDKIRALRNIIDERGMDVDIEVDGGVNLDNVDTILAAGANVFVVGTKIFKGDASKNTEAFLEKLNS